MSNSYRGLQIRPMDSADLSEIENNIETNLGLIQNWIGIFDKALAPTPRPTKAVCIGAGPSLKRCLKSGYIHKDMFPKEDYIIFTCKHALPLLKEYGFKGFYCVVLDPRAVEGVSTHGIVRQNLYEAIDPDTDEVTFMVASMTSPTVTTFLQDRGYKVVGWHAATKALDKFKERVPFCINGGTNSILRSIGLAKDCFGIEETYLLGLDSSLEQPSKEDVDNPSSFLYTELDTIAKSPKYLKSFFGPGEGRNSNKFLSLWTTGELAAQLADLEQFFHNRDKLGLKLRIIGTDKQRSLAGQLADFYGD